MNLNTQNMSAFPKALYANFNALCTAAILILAMWLLLCSISQPAQAQASSSGESTQPASRAPGDKRARDKAFIKAAQFAQNGDYARAYCIYAKYAAKQDAEAEYYLGWMYHNGYGLKIDDQKAASWWEKAGAQGYADALYALGQLYYHGGRGLRRNITKSVDYYLPAAEAGQDEAKLLLKILLAVRHPSTKKKRKEIIQLLGNEPAEALRVRADKANIRRAPSTQANLLKRVKKGTILAEIKTEAEWIQVGFPETGEIGWVFYSLVERAQSRNVQRTVIGEDAN